MNTEDINKTAHRLIDTLPISPMDSYILLQELLETCGKRGGLRNRARACIRCGVEAMKENEKSVTFALACESSLEARSHRRASTLRENRYILGKMMRLCPDLKNKIVRTITVSDCRRWLDACFNTPRQWNKGRVILSGVLNHATKQSWCKLNPVGLLPRKIHKEQRIIPLSLKDINQLLHAAHTLYDGACLPACAIMLFAGLRPQETRRLTWDRINLKANIINIAPEHSKTGGFRQVRIHPVLKKILTPYHAGRKNNACVCPKNWQGKWRAVRVQSGICSTGWIQDILRHTYASYHLAYFMDKKLLQLEMGHQSEELLNRCYLNLENITPASAKLFWKPRLFSPV